MSYLLEFCHEHALAIDFAIFVLIWLVQLIVYPAFHKINVIEFVSWHRKYCNRISFSFCP